MSGTQAVKAVKADAADRRRVRNEIRLLRRKVPSELRKSADTRICRTFQYLNPFQEASHIAGFLAFDGEADPLELMIAAVESGKNVYVPVIIRTGKPLMFSPWTPDTPMIKNSFGIAEPDVPHESWRHPHEIDFVIHPLVAFDSFCHRIGVGGGYYDRTFPPQSQSQQLAPGQRPGGAWLFGFAYEIQQVGPIELNPWDRVLDGVVTERKLYRSFHPLASSQSCFDRPNSDSK